MVRLQVFDHSPGGLRTSFLNNLRTICQQAILPVSHVHQETQLFIMHEVGNNYTGGPRHVLNIFAGTVMGSLNTATNEGIKVNDMTILTKRYHTVDRPSDIYDVIDENGQVLAHYSPEEMNLYIPYQVVGLETQEIIVLFVKTLEVFNEFIKSEFKSWIKSKNKEQMKQRVEEFLKRGRSEAVETLKRNITFTEQRIKIATSEIKNNFDSLVQMKNQLKGAVDLADYGVQNFINGLEAIEKHPQVTEIILDEHLVIIHIKEVYAYVEFPDKERRYYIGNMNVTINMDNTEVFFGGDNPRKSYWSNEDPHPHVSGNTGEACLGNIAPTVAELCSQREIYPLFLTLLDFLESANIEDSAGEHIEYWDEVDEDGKIIQEGRKSSTFYCHCCEEEHYEEDSDEYTVYTLHDGEGGVDGRETWCSHCRENNATWCEENDVYVTDSVYSEIEEYIEDRNEESIEEERMPF